MSADKKSTIQKLQAYNDSSVPILSVYLQLSLPPEKTNGHFSAHVRSILESSLTSFQKQDMRNNILLIESFIKKYHPDGTDKTLAFFTGGKALFEVLHLPYSIENAVHVQHSPYLQPIQKAEEGTRRFLVILTDRARAIYFTLYMDSLEDQKTLYDTSVPKDAKGRAPEVPFAQREDKIQRHVQDHLHRHYKYISQSIQEFVKNREISGVILGGHKNEMSQFEKHLPKTLQSKLLGRFVSELKGDFNEIVKKSKKVISDTHSRQGVAPLFSH